MEVTIHQDVGSINQCDEHLEGEKMELMMKNESPINGWFWGENFGMKFLRLVIYYTGMLCAIGLNFLIFFFSDWHGLIDLTESPVSAAIVNAFKYLALFSVPALAFTFVGHVIYPPVIRKAPIPELEELIKRFENKLYFRIVTRGTNKGLVQRHVRHSWSVLRECLPLSKFRLEVATDNAQELSVACPGMVTELLVPSEYTTSSGSKYKARALQYAIETSEAGARDWIVHLDEETRFDRETVRHVLFHCVKEEEAVKELKKQHGNIGQGTILYGTNEIDNYLTTLADSVRVGDDFGKFRLQYELHEPLIGMHGSFVVAENSVEQMITFNHGMEGSITEDAYFALVARGQGVKFSWIDAFMYEQSPFSLIDFVRQRCRWFVGLWLVCFASKIQMRYRMTLFFFMCTWGLTPMVWVAVLLNMLISSGIPYWFLVLTSLSAGMSTWGYILGFMFTYRLSDGVFRFFGLLVFQILCLPLFAVMEMSGVIHGIVRPPTTGFHVVKKEKDSDIPTPAPVLLENVV